MDLEFVELYVCIWDDGLCEIVRVFGFWLNEGLFGFDLVYILGAHNFGTGGFPFFEFLVYRDKWGLCEATLSNN